MPSPFHQKAAGIHPAFFWQTADPVGTVTGNDTVEPGVYWIDSAASPYLLKRRDDTNTTWETVGWFATSADVASGALINAFDFKNSVRAATTANITLSAPQTIDGVSVIAGDRVLVKNQTTGSENGIYVVAAGAWTRAIDADVSAEVTAGMYVPVEEGTVNADTNWLLTTNNPITLGSTALVFTQFAATAIPTGTAGGDLNGTYPNPLLDVQFKTSFFVFEFGDAKNSGSLEATQECRLPYVPAGTIVRARIEGDVSGSAVVDIKKSTADPPSYSSICASAKPTLASDIFADDTTLTGWTTTLAAGNGLKAVLDSVTTCKQVTVILEVVRT